MKSSWIESVHYRNGFLAIFLKREDRKEEVPALLYSNCPAWMKGLILAGKGGKSIGSAYCKILKKKQFQEKYGIEFQKVVGEWRVAELRKLMES